MSNPGDSNETPIASVDQLAAHLAAGGRPRTEWRIGTEHEKFGFRLPGAPDAFAPPSYAPRGIQDLLGAFAADTNGWDPITDAGSLIGLKGKGPNKGGSLSLEPAGQFELSGAPLATLHQTEQELRDHADALRPHAALLNLGFAPLGFHPTGRRDAMPFMPKSRYKIMRRYMPTVGTLGLDMMLRTCTVQVNLDYASEADMATKLRVSLALQPIATALFANSPFEDGLPNGLLSTRAKIWTDTDNVRSGMPPLFFDPAFGFGRYVEWALDVPMYFVARNNSLIDVAGGSFRAWIQGRLPALAHLHPTVGDFDDHLTTVFTDVRLKTFLEMRGADAGSIEMMVAQSALWTGILYDDAALAAADAMVREQPWTSYATLRAQVPAQGLDAPFGSGTARDLAARMVAIAADGLAGRALRDADGQDERRHLSPLLPIVRGGLTQAEHWLSRYNNEWGGDARRIFAEAAI